MSKYLSKKELATNSGITSWAIDVCTDWFTISSKIASLGICVYSVAQVVCAVV
jgi:hypothetical protein